MGQRGGVAGGQGQSRAWQNLRWHGHLPGRSLLPLSVVSKRHGNPGGGGRMGEAGPPGQSGAFWELGFDLIREVTVRQPLRFLSPLGKWIKISSPDSAAATVRTKTPSGLGFNNQASPAKDGAASG